MNALRLFDPLAQTVSPLGQLVDGFLERAEESARYCPEALAERRRTLDDFGKWIGNEPIEKPIEKLSPETLMAWLDHSTWRSASTRRSKAQEVAAVFAWAARAKKIPANPFVRLELPESDPRRPMLEAEFRTLLRASEPLFRRFLLFLWLTGCRAGEGRGVRWDEVSWEEGRIVKHKHKTRRRTNKPRVIVLVPIVLNLLAWMRRSQPEQTGEIFRNSKGRPWRKETLVTKIARLRKRLGLPAGVVLHGIRHAFGTRCAKRPGCNLKLVSLALGHASVATTEKYYLHLDRETEAIRQQIDGGPGW